MNRQSTEEFRAGKYLYDAIMVDVHQCTSVYTTPKLSHNVNDGLWVIMMFNGGPSNVRNTPP